MYFMYPVESPVSWCLVYQKQQNFFNAPRELETWKSGLSGNLSFNNHVHRPDICSTAATNKPNCLSCTHFIWPITPPTMYLIGQFVSSLLMVKMCLLVHYGSYCDKINWFLHTSCNCINLQTYIYIYIFFLHIQEGIMVRIKKFCIFYKFMS